MRDRQIERMGFFFWGGGREGERHQKKKGEKIESEANREKEKARREKRGRGRQSVRRVGQRQRQMEVLSYL